MGFPYHQQNEFAMLRLMLNDEFWSKLEKILLQEAIYNKQNLRMTVESMLYRMRIGYPWRDLPKAFGCWNSIYKRFNAWSLSRKWLRIFKALAIDPDGEREFIDGSYIKAHQHSTGAAGQEPQAIGKSRAGNTTKIHLAVDGYGLPVEFEITGGEVNDCSAAPQLIAKLPAAQAIVADKGYDSEFIRDLIIKKGAKAVIPRKRNSVKGNADILGIVSIPALGGKRLGPDKTVPGSGYAI